MKRAKTQNDEFFAEHKGVRPEQDVTFELLAELAADKGNPELQPIIEEFRQKAAKA